MSKRWQLPTQKGTEPFPNITQPPPKLMIEGVDTGTPLYRAVAERFGGRLKQFHGHCQQDYSLTNNEVMKRRISFGDEASATYANLHGQEILSLRVSAGVIEQEKHKKKQPWDWALVEYKVVFSGAADSINMRAVRVSPPPIEAGVTEDGYVYDSAVYPGNVDGLSPPVTQYPVDIAHATLFTTTDEFSQISALAIDMRRFNTGPSMYDLSGYLTAIGERVDFYAAPDAALNSFSNTTLGSTVYDAIAHTWTPPLASILNLWPYQGTAEVPVTWPAASPLYNTYTVQREDAASFPVPMIPQPLVNFRGDDSFPPGENFQDVHYYNIVYDPDSGIATSFDVSTIVDPGSTNLGGSQFRHDFSYQTQHWSRSVVIETEPYPVPTTNLGDISFTGGYGVPPWVTVAVIGSDVAYDRLGVTDGASFKFLQTGVLKRDVPISNPDPSYNPVGRFLVDPVTQSGAFELP